MDLLTEMRIPTRAAPRPPHNDLDSQRNSGLWGSSNDLFGSAVQAPQKKKPPPRPPPPKFTVKHVNIEEKPKKAVRPTELLTNLFGRRGLKHQQQQQQQQQQHNSHHHLSQQQTQQYKYQQHHHHQQQQQQQQMTNSSTATTFQMPTAKLNENSNGVCLIDLSPPGSPTFTTRSSSDGVSVDSFGSDGNSNPSLFISSGSASQTESVFEDDFDFFGSLSSKRQQSGDPWRVSCTQDPFGSFESSVPTTKANSQPWPVSVSQTTKEVGESNFFAFNETRASEFPVSKPSFVMPTIIRVPNPNKPTAPKPTPGRLLNPRIDYSGAPRLNPANEPATDNLFWEGGDSPPMPTQPPPPPPPPEYIAELEEEIPRNPGGQKPYGVALYDFLASQDGDLGLKEGDLVQLTGLVNDSWIKGRVGDREGIFPASFVDVKLPLPGQNANVVNALYAFKAEIAQDLSFEEGARIKVLSRISDDWLYGECDGKKGQFPANFVDKVPSDLPLHL